MGSYALARRPQDVVKHVFAIPEFGPITVVVIFKLLLFRQPYLSSLLLDSVSLGLLGLFPYLLGLHHTKTVNYSTQATKAAPSALRAWPSCFCYTPHLPASPPSFSQFSGAGFAPPLSLEAYHELPSPEKKQTIISWCCPLTIVAVASWLYFFHA
jgi:hypothetical protein